jgi:CubicO group peptidase (beta-lactamase class C family)
MPIDPARLKSAIDAVLARGVADGDVPGVVAAVTNRDSMIYEGAFGVRALGGTAAMTPDTIFRIASLTKAVTATGVMQLVERGVLDLDAPAGKLMPYLGEVQVLAGFDDRGQPILRSPVTPDTMRHLLTHTSGFAYPRWSPPLARFMEVMNFALKDRDWYRTPLVFDPGTGWQYGTGSDWAAMVLEAASGQGLEAFIRDNLFDPLGMTGAWTVPRDKHPLVAAIHQRVPGGTLVLDDSDPPEQLPYEDGGHGINTTAADYLKFIRMILNRGTGNGNRVLREETVAEMSRPDAAPANAMTPLITTNPRESNGGEFFPGVRKRHGLGFMVTDDVAPTGRPPGSLAWAGYWNCYYWIDPTNGIGGVYLTQILPFLDVRALPLFYGFEAAVYGAMG